LWLDAADVNTLFSDTGGTTLATNGGTIARWNDKTANGNYVFQSTAGNRPVRSTIPSSSLPAVYFSTAGLGLVSSSNNSQSGNLSRTLFVVLHMPTTTSRVIVSTGPHNTATPPNTFGVDAWTGYVAAPYVYNSADNSFSFQLSGLSSMYAYYDSSVSQTGGGYNFGTFATKSTTLNTTASPWYIGYRPDGVGSINSYVAEILIYSTALTTAQRQQIEGYLAQKWGLASVMPATHPFGLSIAPSPQAFSPRDIDGCALWLDAADSTTLTLSGSNVTQWTDKSGTANNAVLGRFGMLGPTRTSSNSLLFTRTPSSVQYLRTQSGRQTTVDATYFVVVKALNDNGGSGAFFDVRKNTGQPLYTLNATDVYVRGTTGSTFASFPYAFPQTFTIVCFRSTTNVFQLFANGTRQVNSTATLDMPATDTAFTTVGALTDLETNSNQLVYSSSSEMGEVLMYNAYLSDSQRQQVEGYLAWKWGLIPSIPSPHPYKLALPYVRQFSPKDIAGCTVWLDGGDVNGDGSAVAGGTAVSTWVNKSGSSFGNFIQSTSSNRPVVSNVNGNSVVRFNATSNTTTFLSNTTAYNYSTGSLYIVFQQTDKLSADNPGVYTILPTNSGGSDWNGSNGVSITPVNNMSVFGLGGTVNLNLTSTPQAQSPLGIYTFQTNNNAGSGFFNSSPWSGTIVNGGATQFLAASAGQGIGARYQSGAWTNNGGLGGYICEVLLFNRFLQPTERQQVEGYLAWKWNLTTNLPAAHPFEDKPPYAQPFLPTNIAGCSMWLDAADTGSVVLSGSNVTQWSDKSGNGRNAVVSSTAYATYSNSGLYFANSLYTTTLSASPTSETLFLVFNNTSSSNTGAIIGAYNGGREIANYDSNRTVGIVKAQIVWGPYANFPAFNAKYMAACIVSPTATKVIVNGGTSITTGSAITFSSSSNTILGREAGVDFGVTGIMHEVISFNSVLSDTQRQQVEGYLAWKWGLTSFLSVGHPFKYSAPSYYIPPFTPTDLAGCSLWLDAADPTSLTLSGSTVTTWADKSGNSKNATALTAASYANNGLVFTGTQSYDIPLNFTSTQSGFIVVSHASTNTMDVLGMRYISGTTPGYQIIISGNTQWINAWGGARVVTGRVVNQNTPFLYGYTFQSGGATGTNITYANGVQTGTNGSTAPTLSGSATLMIGSYVNGGTQAEYFIGTINEIVLYSTILTTTQRQMVENYLSWKWGLNQSLVVRPNVRPMPLYTRPVNPLDMTGCRVWLDATDATTLTLSTNSVTQWNDKSGNGYNATAGTSPTYNSTTKYILFNGSTQFLNLAAGAIPFGNAAYSIFIVAYTTNTANPQWVLTGGTENGTGNVVGILFYVTNAIWHSWWINEYRVENVVTNNTPAIINASYNGTTRNIIVNGGSSNLNTPGTRSSASSPNFIGKRSAGQFFGGGIGEIIIFDSEIAPPQRQQIEGYLAWKWGLSSSIATAHPFKRFPSLTTTFAPPQLSGLSLWLDAADPSTITTTGTVISSWRDKSGNRNNATSVNSPTYNPILNGVNFVRASSQYFTLPDGTLPYNDSSYSYIFIYTPTTTTSAQTYIYGGTNAALRQATGIRSGDLGTGTLQTYWVGYDLQTSATYTLNTKNIAATFYTSGGGRSVWMNFVQAASDTPGVTRIQPATGNTIGSLAGTTDFLGGLIHELIVYNSALSITQRQQVEGYLAWKWGLVGSLPSTHPYKKFTP
jgi:hypothetical protein